MIVRKFRRALTLTAAERRLAVEAFALLAFVRVVLVLLPFQRATQRLGLRLDRGGVLQEEDGGAVAIPSVLLVRDAVRRAASVAPFRAVCLQQAFAAALMLRRRGHGVQVHLGVAKDGSGNLTAHAWSLCQGTMVTGGEQMPRFRPISVFVT
ncbi:lasso peptide biosynthesis B2 protein [Niveispirillum sp. SYP-B3756]|uniref:lasso peptide biosynthesis B2 protein n=1 Tax=Niveispirillum sp. SYP-B3756 TaxID=2662178 RepID=UPI00129282C1|nr:lasso peptide biosynthesis B2 protein [Niveispirillum sp. SYP-B3756]MQP68084.1 lasso peptide biosynthesis B2 protein [Niveispirillum sp. SYP-B3756]